MKFYIKGQMITTDDTPLILVLTEKDRENITNMKPGHTIYAQFEADNHSCEEIEDLCSEAIILNIGGPSKPIGGI